MYAERSASSSIQHQSINQCFQSWCTATKLFELLMLFHALFNADPSLVQHMKLKLIHACNKSLESSSSSSSSSCKSVFFFLKSTFSMHIILYVIVYTIFWYWEFQGPNSFKVNVVVSRFKFAEVYQKCCFRVQVYFLKV